MAAELQLQKPASRAEWVVPVATVATIFVMLVPVPAIVLDIFLALSITLGVVVLLSALYILKPVQFSVFPTTPSEMLRARKMSSTMAGTGTSMTKIVATVATGTTHSARDAGFWSWSSAAISQIAPGCAACVPAAAVFMRICAR